MGVCRSGDGGFPLVTGSLGACIINFFFMGTTIFWVYV